MMIKKQKKSIKKHLVLATLLNIFFKCIELKKKHTQSVDLFCD
jgi:hypothetical protein